MPKVRGRVTGGLLEGYWRVTGGLLEGYWRVTGGLLEGYWRVLERWTSTNMDVCCLFAVSLLFFKQPKTAHHRRLWDGECVEIEV
jgi:hypothetical protein